MQQRLVPATREYLKYRRSEGKAASTLSADETAMNALIKHTKKFARKEPDGLFVHSITHDHMSHVLVEMSESRGPNAMSITYSQFNRFFAWAETTKRIKGTDNPMANRKAPKFRKRLRERLPVSEFPRLLDACNHPRDRILLALGLYLMVRVSEIRTIRLSSVMLPVGEILVRIHKSGIDDFMPISEELDIELRRWLKWYAEACGGLKPHYYLVPSKSSPIPAPVKGMPRGTIVMDPMSCRMQPEKMISKRASGVARDVLERIGFPVRDENGKLKGEGTHTLRRSGARAMFDGAREQGVEGSLTRVKTMLHHASVTDTEWYIGANLDKVERDEAVKGKKLFPQLAALEADNILAFPGEASNDPWGAVEQGEWA